MKKLFVGLFIMLVLSVVASATLNKDIAREKVQLLKQEKVTSKITIEQEERCETFPVPGYGACTEQYVIRHCRNTSGPDTNCRDQTKTYSYTCKKENEFIEETVCKPVKKFNVRRAKEPKPLRIGQPQEEVYSLDFSDFGPCKTEEENGCAVITCVSKHDGAYKNHFTRCDGGQSCQKIVVCADSIETYVKNSRTGFVKSDPSFVHEKLELREAGE